MDHLYDCGQWEKRSSSPSNEPLLPFPHLAHQLAQSPHIHPNALHVGQLLDLLSTDLLKVNITYFNSHFCILRPNYHIWTIDLLKPTSRLAGFVGLVSLAGWI